MITCKDKINLSKKMIRRALANNLNVKQVLEDILVVLEFEHDEDEDEE